MKPLALTFAMHFWNYDVGFFVIDHIFLKVNNGKEMLQDEVCCFYRDIFKELVGYT